jgi:hypothetical protein
MVLAHRAARSGAGQSAPRCGASAVCPVRFGARATKAIRDRTGVTVPLPEERGAVTGALLNAVLLRKGRAQQLSLDFGLAADAAAMETKWRDAEEGERR